MDFLTQGMRVKVVLMRDENSINYTSVIQIHTYNLV